jgi:hypothetical protein
MAEVTTTFDAFDANGNQIAFNAEQNTTTQALAPHHVLEIGGLPMGPGNPEFISPGAITPIAGVNFTVVTAGTAVNAINANALGTKGGKIVNLGTVGAFVDYVNVAGTVSPGTFGTTFPIAANATIDVPPGCTNAVSLNATDNNHPFIVVSW